MVCCIEEERGGKQNDRSQTRFASKKTDKLFFFAFSAHSDVPMGPVQRNLRSVLDKIMQLESLVLGTTGTSGPVDPRTTKEPRVWEFGTTGYQL